MAKRRLLLRLVMALFVMAAAWLPGAARADYDVAFYAHDRDKDFPHAFFTVKGAPATGGTAVDTNYGFTAVKVSPGILFGSVAGTLDTADAGYIGRSKRVFALHLDDARYAALMAVVQRWGAARQPSYNLNKHNCVHFIGEAAQAVGLRVVFDKTLMKKPHSFLTNVRNLNPQLGNPS